jgi:1-aminocyclopropane-1-carboxylate deaminase/D-cysteine desulfhydrase-like pyridoxal-dependent ACC family enzyme
VSQVGHSDAPSFTLGAPSSELPLYDRFPALRAVPRVALGSFPSPVEAVRGLAGISTLWLKRDDLNASEMGGNKVRSLEFLLAGVEPGDTVLTLGGHGSTHVLATATHARRLGAATVALGWPHAMHPVAERVRNEARARGVRAVAAWTAVDAIVRAQWLRRAPGVRYVPIGGSTPLGVLGHVNAGLELASQIRSGLLPEPARLVVPLGSGGTAAGLALGLAIAGLRTVVVGARVGPRVAVNRRRLLALAEGARRLITRVTGEPCPRVPARGATVVHDVYGGAYGRPLAAGARAAAELAACTDARCDATYSEKALAAALAIARASREPTLFWLTFDARWLQAGARGA